ncbi:MAG: hypothetical protein V5A52_07040 [Halovenus sp.]
MSESEQSGAGRREVAYRIFAAEFNDADFSFSESDEERAPSYVVTPTGARANRLFVVGVLTEIEAVSEDVLRGRVVDPTGAFVLYAGQYQPDEQAFLERAEPPMFVAVTGKARTFQPEDSDQVFTSIRPESISEVDAKTRDRWIIQAAEQTTERIGWMAHAMTLNTGEGLREMLVDRGADDGLAHGIELALAEYGTTPTYLDALREMALDTARVVADQKDEITAHSKAPDAAGDLTAEELAARVTVDVEEPSTTADTGQADVSQPDQSAASESTPADTSDEPTEAGTADSGTDSATAETESTESVPDETAATPESTEATEETPADAEEPSTASAGSAETASPEGSASADSEGEDADDLGDFEPEEFELEAETREEVEEEFGTEFQTGTEVDDPGEAGIETPEEVADEPPTSDPDATAQADAADGAAESADTPDQQDEPAETIAEPEPDPEPADQQATGTDEPDEEEPEDLQAAVVELMGELDTGDGADKEDLIAEMDARYGTDRETVEDAIQDALMDGQCYEPDDSLLKPI